MLTLGLSIGLCLVTVLLSYSLCGRFKKTRILDAPDGVRKHQAAPVSRLGGIGIALSAVVCGIAFVALASFWEPAKPLFEAERAWIVSQWPGVAFVVIALLIGFIDDLGKAETVPKLLALLIIAALVSVFGLHPAALTTPWWAVDGQIIVMLGSVLWLVVFTNAVNFMDGSNGLAVGCVTIMLVGLAVIGIQTEALTLTHWWVVLLGAVVGFLIHNLSGSLYAGDAGALGLGALFASLSIVVGVDVWIIAILALPFLIDVLLTLVWRTKNRRNLLEAHLDHAYQRLIASGWSHLETAVLYWGLSATAASAAYIASLAGGDAPFAIFWTLLLAGSAIWVLHRRSTNLSDQNRE